MKLVKEHINEKFKEDSDPIKDMKIGIKAEDVLNKFVKAFENEFEKFCMWQPFNTFSDDPPYFIKFDQLLLGYEIQVNYAHTKQAAEQIIETEALTNIVPSPGWIVMSYSQYTKNTPFHVEPFDFEPIFKEIYIVKYGTVNRIDKKIKDIKENAEKTIKELRRIKSKLK